jgi:hypothetical protein
MNAMTSTEITTIVNANIGGMAELTVMGTSPTGPVVTGTVSGQLISINSKGVNVRTSDNKVVSRSLSRIAWVAIDEGDVELSEDDEADMLADMIDEGVIDAEIDAHTDDDEADDEYDGEETDDDIEVAAAEDGIANVDLPDADTNALVAELDGATTADLADVFGIAAKELRVTLRALGMGVGKGRRYHLTADQITTVRTALTPTA